MNTFSHNLTKVVQKVSDSMLYVDHRKINLLHRGGRKRMEFVNRNSCLSIISSCHSVRGFQMRGFSLSLNHFFLLFISEKAYNHCGQNCLWSPDLTIYCVTPTGLLAWGPENLSSPLRYKPISIIDWSIILKLSVLPPRLWYMILNTSTVDPQV